MDTPNKSLNHPDCARRRPGARGNPTRISPASSPELPGLAVLPSNADSPRRTPTQHSGVQTARPAPRQGPSLSHTFRQGGVPGPYSQKALYSLPQLRPSHGRTAHASSIVAKKPRTRNKLGYSVSVQLRTLDYNHDTANKKRIRQEKQSPNRNDTLGIGIHE